MYRLFPIIFFSFFFYPFHVGIVIVSGFVINISIRKVVGAWKKCVSRVRLSRTIYSKSRDGTKEERRR